MSTAYNRAPMMCLEFKLQLESSEFKSLACLVAGKQPEG